jgi:hypothetical protein
MAIVSQYRGNVHAVAAALSPPRFQTYLDAKYGVYHDAMDLYEWNAKVSNALFFSMHVCEVVIRNAASDAISTVYGNQWPYSHAFHQSLPNPKGNRVFNPRRELQRVAKKHPTASGKVIADLKFMFWESMFTSRFDVQIWHNNLQVVLPHASTVLSISSSSQLRHRIYKNLNLIRGVRNRIAHHEPIFHHKLQEVLDAANELVSCRCPSTYQWLSQSEMASHYLQNTV